MSWLRRSVESDSTWLRLHKQEVYPHAFDPYKSDFESLSKAKSICKNPFWKDVYSSLIDCRLNILLDFPDEYKYISINGQPHMTSNNIPMRQEWAMNKCLSSIINRKGNLRDINEIRESRKPFVYEYKELKVILKDFLDTDLGGRLTGVKRQLII